MTGAKRTRQTLLSWWATATSGLVQGAQSIEGQVYVKDSSCALDTSRSVESLLLAVVCCRPRFERKCSGSTGAWYECVSEDSVGSGVRSCSLGAGACLCGQMLLASGTTARRRAAPQKNVQPDKGAPRQQARHATARLDIPGFSPRQWPRSRLFVAPLGKPT